MKEPFPNPCSAMTLSFACYFRKAGEVPLSKRYYPQIHGSENKLVRRVQHLSSHSGGKRQRDALTPGTYHDTARGCSPPEPTEQGAPVTVWGRVGKPPTQDRAQLWACFRIQQ